MFQEGFYLPNAVAELIERGHRLREIGSLVPDQVKPMTYKIDIPSAQSPDIRLNHIIQTPSQTVFALP